MLHSPDNAATAKAVWGKIGEVTTGLAMVAQGLLAGLLGDYIIRKEFDHLNPVILPIIRTMVFAALTGTAFEGKRRLITYFNSSSFEGIATIDLKKFLRDLTKDYLKILNYLWSTIPSLGFAYLTKFALIGGANFLRNYEVDQLDIIADAIAHPATIWVLGGTSFISNMLSFPGLHERGFSFLKDMLQSLFSPSTTLEAKIGGQLSDEQTPLLLTTQPEQVKTNKVATSSHWQIRASIVLGLSIAAYIAMGLSNFIGIGNDMAADFFDLDHSPRIRMIFGAMMMASMCCMAMHVGQDVCQWGKNLGRTHQQSDSETLSPEILSKGQKNRIKLESAIVCALGGAPNAYQSLMIADQALFYVIAAAIASFALEVGGYYKLTYEKAKAKERNRLEQKNQIADQSPENHQTAVALEPKDSTHTKKASAWFSCFRSKQANAEPTCDMS